MKKHPLVMPGYVLLYVLIFLVMSIIAAALWFGVIPRDFAQKNTSLIFLVGLGLTIAVYALIFKLRKQSLLKTCQFAPINRKGIFLIMIAGTLMGLFTCLICNTSYILKNAPIFERYLKTAVDQKPNFLVFILTLPLSYLLEEMVFRGAIFNEIRNNGVPVYIAVLIATAIYGILNGLNFGVHIGIYASLAAFFFTLGYVYLRSLYASVILQFMSILFIYIMRKTNIFTHFQDLGSMGLTIGIGFTMALILVCYYFMRQEYQKNQTIKSASVSG